MTIALSVAVSNQSTVLSNAEVIDALPAFHYQATYHFAPHWHTSANLHFADPKSIPVGMSHIAILDDSDQAGALGYHDLDKSLAPDAFIFARTDKQYGLSWSVTFSHELLEILGDEWISSCWQFSDTEFYAQEVCDPVEADELGYEISLQGHSPVLVSDFILPRWFIPGAPPKYDRMGHCSKPGEILSGGYMSIYDASIPGWTQETNFNGKVERRQIADRKDRPSQEIRRMSKG